MDEKFRDVEEGESDEEAERPSDGGDDGGEVEQQNLFDDDDLVQLRVQPQRRQVLAALLVWNNEAWDSNCWQLQRIGTLWDWTSSLV